MSELESTPDDDLPQTASRRAELARRLDPPSWDEIGDSFETLGKVGLAMAIGFSAAGLFCRLAEQGKVRVPSLSNLLIPRGEEPKKKRA